MCAAAASASRVSGSSRFSQRMQALPFAMMPPRGWLISCAIDLVSTSMLIIRVAWVSRSMCATSLARSSSARLRSMISAAWRAYKSVNLSSRSEGRCGFLKCVEIMPRISPP